MRLVLPALLLIALCADPATAQSDDGGAYGQLQNATSGNQTLDQTYGDNGHGESCPDACPTGNANVPDPGQPQPDDSANSNDQNNDGNTDDSGG